MAEKTYSGIIDMQEELKAAKVDRTLRHRIGFWANKFFYSGIYIFLLSLIVFLCWFFEGEAAGVAIFCIFAGAYLAFKDDITPLIPIVFLIAMMFPKDIDPMQYASVFYFFIPLGLGMIIHVIRFKPRGFGKLFFPQLAVSAVLLLGGLGTISKEHYASGLAFAIMLGVLILVLYALFYAYSKPPKDVDLKLYVSKILLAVGLVILAQILTFYLRNPQAIKQVGGAVNLGWAIGNNFSTILLISVSACFYMASRSRLSVVYLGIAVLEYIGIIISWSRGATLLAAIILPLFIVYLLVKAKKYRKQNFIALAILLAVLIVIAGVFHKPVLDMIKAILAQGTGNSGRTELYNEAVDCFIANPIFGGGIGFHGNYYKINNMPMYWFHSTAYQIIGSMGLAGVAAYVYYYISRYRIIIKRDAFNIFILIGMLGFEGYSMIDTGTFVPVPIMLCVILLTMLVEFTNMRDLEQKKENGTLMSKLSKSEAKALYGDQEYVRSVYALHADPRAVVAQER